MAGNENFGRSRIRTLVVDNPITGPGALTAATTSTAGTVKKAVAQVDSTAPDVATLKTDFNALLQKLRDAGILS